MENYIVRIQLLKGELNEDGVIPTNAVEIESDVLNYQNLDNALAIYRAAQEHQKSAYDAGVADACEKVAW